MSIAHPESTGSVPIGAATFVERVQPRPLFARTMGYVSATAVLFTVGAYLGRDLNGVVGLIAFVAALVALISMRFAAAKSVKGTIALLGLVGVLLGLALASTLGGLASVEPQVVWQAGAATALFITGFGVAGYATTRDLSVLARASSWAVLGLLAFGLVIVFVNIPGLQLLYSVLGLVIFAGYTVVDFQRLRRVTDLESAPLLAASIFLDVLNVFLFFTSLFSRNG